MMPTSRQGPISRGLHSEAFRWRSHHLDESPSRRRMLSRWYPHLDEPPCISHKKATALILTKNGPNPLKFCKISSFQIEAFKLGKFGGSIWMSTGGPSRRSPHLDEPPSRRRILSRWCPHLDETLYLDKSSFWSFQKKKPSSRWVPI